MSRVTPRRIVEIIEVTYPWTNQGSHDGTLRQDQSANLGMIASLVKQLPLELLPSDPDDYTAYVAAVGAIDSSLLAWAGLSHLAASPLYPLTAFGNRAPVLIIRDVLKKCPEEGVIPSTHGLDFVEDQELRNSLRRDFSQSRNALDRGDFKASTVLAGAVVEALLLYALQATSDDDRKAARAQWAGQSKRPGDPKPPRQSSSNIDQWTLSEMIWIARHADLISDTTAASADVARDYRNLIHPGKERTLAPSDEGTAFAALGAALRIATELEHKSK